MLGYTGKSYTLVKRTSVAAMLAPSIVIINAGPLLTSRPVLTTHAASDLSGLKDIRLKALHVFHEVLQLQDV